MKTTNKHEQQTYYRQRQAQLLAEAIEWQYRFINGDTIYWSEIAEAGAYFAKYGKRYGLLREFHENAIC